MVVHNLHIAWREAKNPSIQILAAKKIDAPLALLAALRHLQNIQDFHRNLLLVWCNR
jgi:hypothetical protein